MFGLVEQSASNGSPEWLEPLRGAVLFGAKRLIGLLAVLLAISFGTFSLLHIAPGDPAQLLLGTRQQSPAVLNAVRHEYHLDKPFLTQYWIWARACCRFDFGQFDHARTTAGLEGHHFSARAQPLSRRLRVALVAVLVGVGARHSRRRRKTPGSLDRGTVVGFGVIGCFDTGVRERRRLPLRVRGASQLVPGLRCGQRLRRRALPPHAARDRAGAHGDGARDEADTRRDDRRPRSGLRRLCPGARCLRADRALHLRAEERADPDRSLPRGRYWVPSSWGRCW